MALPRYRLLNFRLTDEEYDQLRSAAVEHGSRGLSDFARTILLSSLPAQAVRDRRESATASLSERLAKLEQAVDRLTNLLKNSGASTEEVK